MKSTKYCIGILLISFLFNSNLYAGKHYKDLYGNKEVLLTKSCVTIEDFRSICYYWSERYTTHDSVYFEEKRLLLVPDTALFRRQYKMPFNLRRIVQNKRERREYDKQLKEGKKSPMVAITYEQAKLYIELAEKLYPFNDPITPTNSYSLPTLKDYEIALKKKILTNGAEYLADGNIVIIDTKNKKLEVVTSTNMPVRFRLLIHKINTVR
jgi:hypothetical protein